jgi:predicted MPP superfamily phosphohydrolase
MLAHEPAYYSLYQELGADLVLTGHVHGGQIIFPGKGGFLSPDFTFFPELYEGMHDLGGMDLIVSRGLGNSVAPVRINDYPELVVVKAS